jgi:hypothetical protein
MPQILPHTIAQLAFPLIPSPSLSLFAPSVIQRQDILNRVQSNAMVSQAWTDWALVSPAVYSSSLVGLSQIQAFLNVTQGLYPTSPHVLVAQQVITSRQPPLPPQPPAPPAPGTRQPTMPLHRIMPAPGSQIVLRTSNELIYNSATASPHIGNQPGGIHQMPPPTGSNTLTDARQVNPFLPPSSATPPVSQQSPIHGSRSTRALQQFFQPSQAVAGVLPAGQPPVARPMPPTMNQMHPPNLHQGPHAPHQTTPRGLGGGGHSGGVVEEAAEDRGGSV